MLYSDFLKYFLLQQKTKFFKRLGDYFTHFYLILKVEKQNFKYVLTHHDPLILRENLHKNLNS